MLTAWRVSDIRGAEEIRLAEVAEGALMQRAAAGLAAVCARELRSRTGGVSGRRVVLLVGAGNNGGDALYAGERLARRGARVDAVLLAAVGRVHQEGAAALRAAGGRVVFGEDAAAVSAVLTPAQLVIDGIVGLGGSPGLREDATRAVSAIGPCAVVVAVDLPSGVDPDTGELPPPDEQRRPRHVTAEVTVTFGAHKPCLLLPPAASVCGRVELVDIGLGPLLPLAPAVQRFESPDAARCWPVPGTADHKFTRGVLGMMIGSPHYPGAAVLGVAGAQRAGAGLVRYLGSREVADGVLAAHPETVIGVGAGDRVDAWVIGSGLPPAMVLEEFAARDELHGVPAVLDAGGLVLAERPLLPRRAVLTPHAGEAARLLARLGEPASREAVEAAPVHHARRVAELTGAVVVLKGATTLIVQSADGASERAERLAAQADATPWLATAGAGDVLAGVIGALLASGRDPFEAACTAVLVHGRAARLAAGCQPDGSGGGPITAGDVAAALPRAVRGLLDLAGRAEASPARIIR